jgi:hypothetical protein
MFLKPVIAALIIATAILLLSFVGIVPAFAADELDLSELGYSPDSYMTLIAWQEQTRSVAGAMVHGARLKSLVTEEAFDLYWDEEGRLLDAIDMARLGIKPKNWSRRSVTIPPEIVPGFPKAATLPSPAPKAVPPRISRALPPLDIEAILLEDEWMESQEGKGVIRIGVLRDLEAPIRLTEQKASDGGWQPHPDGGQTWALEIYSPEAYGMRVHFARLNIPEGIRVILYNANDPVESYGPFTSQDDFWAPTCFNESVIVECYVSPETGLDGIEIEIDQISHHYRAFEDYAKAGTCNLDVSCYPEWGTPALGVGGLGRVSTTGSLFCTGSLLANNIPLATIPYLLTANHCLSTANDANSLEVYWLYQTPECGGAAPSPANVPRTTGGADLLATSSLTRGTDFTLLRLRNSPPAGLVWLGFTTEIPTLSTPVVCIHHPTGSFKRISFGNITDDGSPSGGGIRLQPISRFHEVVWSAGTTENGSSGSPLLRESTQMLIGQLWGGRASCARPKEPDYYGRFDVTWPLVEAWLEQTENPFDIDGSGKVNSADLQLVINAALARSQNPRTDLDGSGRTDAVDVQIMLIFLLNQR